MNVFDSIINYVAPVWGVKRTAARFAQGKMSATGYVNPGDPKKSMKGTVARSLSPQRDTLPKLEGSRALSRDMYMNTSMASGILKTCRTNVAGGGLRFQSRIDYNFLGLTEDQADEWEANTERLFEIWAESTYADNAGILNFYEMQALNVLSTHMNGDGFTMPIWRKPKNSGNWPFELRLKMIEADLCRNPAGKDTNNTVKSDTKKDYPGGVQKNTHGEVTYYHIANTYPNGVVYDDKEKFVAIPVRDRTGRANIWHHMPEVDRVGQVRGMPWLAAVLEPLKQITRLSESVLMKALISSYYTVFVKDMSASGATQQQGYTPEESVTGGGAYGPDSEPEPKNPGDEFDLEMGVGNIEYLEDDKEIVVADPKSTDKDFEPFFNSLITQVASGINMSSEQLLGKFTSSYSAARAALLEAYKQWRVKKQWLASSFCVPTFHAWMEEAVAKGYIDAPGFFDSVEIKNAWCGGAWVGTGMGQLNPKVETEASVLKLNNNLSTHADEYHSMGGTKWDSAMRRKSREKKTLSNLELTQEEPQQQQPTNNNSEAA